MRSQSEAKYPVLYLHDGQNLFDAATAFGNQEWGVDEAAEELITSGVIEPLIIVGIYNAGEKRLEEYTHVRNRKGQGGRARRHAQFVVEELKPFIDSTYRTLSDPANTGLGGSSLGGLVTLYMGLHYPRGFRQINCDVAFRLVGKARDPARDQEGSGQVRSENLA